jgi:hypothetical protein
LQAATASALGEVGEPVRGRNDEGGSLSDPRRPDLMDFEKFVNDVAPILNGIAFHSHHAYVIQMLEYYERVMASPRSLEPNRLLRHGFKAYSQNDEDGILQEIFVRIGTTTKVFVEFGVETGLECNTLYLLLSGWKGLWMDGSLQNISLVHQRFRTLEDAQRLRAAAAHITAENINPLIAQNVHETQVDLLSIDIDFNDYWVWKAIDVIQPRVVVIEYNATIRPPVSVAVAYDPQRAWNGSNYFGASLSAFEKLGRTKGYCLVGCNFSGANSFFVRDDLVGNHFCKPFTAENHYEPPRYFLQLPAGHRPEFGNFVQIE